MDTTAFQEMVASYDRLVYMVKTTAPHLQSNVTDLRERIKAALVEAANPKPAEGPPAPTPDVAPPEPEPVPEVSKPD